jgi:hypothetical protein
MYQQLRLEPYAVHTTFQYAGTEGKRHRLREAMLFFDQPTYYDSPGLFTVYPHHKYYHSQSLGIEIRAYNSWWCVLAYMCFFCICYLKLTGHCSCTIDVEIVLK